VTLSVIKDHTAFGLVMISRFATALLDIGDRRAN